MVVAALPWHPIRARAFAHAACPRARSRRRVWKNGRVTTAADLQSRYGGRAPRIQHERTERRRLSRPAVIGIGVGLAAAIGVAAWYSFAPNPTPDGTVTISYDVVDSTLTRTTIGVYPDDERDITCSLRAVSEHEAVVGYTEVTVPADPQSDGSSPVTVSADISTTQLAASGHHESCWYADDPRF